MAGTLSFLQGPVTVPFCGTNLLPHKLVGLEVMVGVVPLPVQLAPAFEMGHVTSFSLTQAEKCLGLCPVMLCQRQFLIIVLSGSYIDLISLTPLSHVFL